MERFGILGFLILIGDIYAVLKIVQSASTDGAKALWIAVVVAMPGLGLVLWFFFGPKPR